MMKDTRLYHTRKTQEDFLDKVAGEILRNNAINEELYQKYDVKRGLRNSNGTGVLVGLTKIGSVDGYDVIEDKKVAIPGKLYYRGIDVEDLTSACLREKRFGYEETSYLLLFGQLPNGEELKAYQSILGEKRELPFSFVRDVILTAPSINIMNKLARCILGMYSFDDNPDDISLYNIMKQSIDLVAKMPAIICYGYQAMESHNRNVSLHFYNPLPELSTAENILRMIRPTGEYTELEATLLDICLIIHAEHGGGNNSAFTTHVISSSGTDTYSAISAAVGSLKGPKHGGANIEVINMIRGLKEYVSDISNRKEVDDYVTKILRKEAGDRSGLLYGFGHAVYTLSDPRAVILKKMARRLAEDKNLTEEFALYDYIESQATRLYYEARGHEKNMMANVDFYSGFVYSALNIPIEISTPLFAASRISGWCAHRMEEIITGGKIMRPAYQDVAENHKYVPLKER